MTHLWKTIPKCRSIFVLNVFISFTIYIGLQRKADDGNGNVTELHFPGFSGSAVEWLIDNRNILGVGVDTVSCDPGKDTLFSAHVASITRNKVCIENLKIVDKVPDCGAR